MSLIRIDRIVRYRRTIATGAGALVCSQRIVRAQLRDTADALSPQGFFCGAIEACPARLIATGHRVRNEAIQGGFEKYIGSSVRRLKRERRRKVLISVTLPKPDLTPAT